MQAILVLESATVAKSGPGLCFGACNYQESGHNLAMFNMLESVMTTHLLRTYDTSKIEIIQGTPTVSQNKAIVLPLPSFSCPPPDNFPAQLLSIRENQAAVSF